MTKRLLLAFSLLLAPLTAHAADAIVLMDAAGQTLYVRVYTSSSAAVAAALTAGTSGNTRRYAVTDAALVSASMTATPGNYAYDVFVGTPSTSAADYAIASGILRWGGTVAVDPLPLVTTGSSGGLLIAGSNAATTFSTLTSTGAFSINGTPTVAQSGDGFARLGAPAGASVSADLATIAADTNEVQGDWADGGRLDLLLDAKATAAQVAAVAVAAVSPDRVSKQRTWIGREYRASNIVEVGDNFAGVLSLIPDVNPNASILTVDSVSITGAAVVVATDLTTTADRMRANFTVPALTTVGTYTVVVTVTTTDGDTIPTTATLIVR